MSGMELEPRRERRPEKPYLKQAKYSEDGPALSAYNQVRGILFGLSGALSAYRIKFENVPHVVVLGLQPSRDIDNMIEGILRHGEQSELPEDIIAFLWERGEQARRVAPWVEVHYRPGKPM